MTPGLDILKAPSALAFRDVPDIHTPSEAALPSLGVGSGGLSLVGLKAEALPLPGFPSPGQRKEDSS